MIYDLSTAAYNAIAEAFKDHLDGDFFSGSEVVNIDTPNGREDVTVIISADLYWKSVQIPEGSYPVLNAVQFRNIEIYPDHESATINVEPRKMAIAFLKTNQ